MWGGRPRGERPPASRGRQPGAQAEEEVVRIAGYEGVTAREYRAFLRRQRLYRERIEREQVRLRERYELQDEADGLPRLYAGNVLLREATGPPADEHEANDDQMDTLSVRTNTTTYTNGTAPTSPLSQPQSTNNGLSLPSSRCRVCHSRTCVSLEHLRMASQQRNRQVALTVTPEEEVLNATPVQDEEGTGVRETFHGAAPVAPLQARPARNAPPSSRR